MCGLTGFSGKKKFNKDKIKSLMLWNSLERGKDSTGIYSPLNGLLKEAEEGYKFLTKTKFEEDKLFVGHVRSSTVGVKSQKNAHPFMEENIVLAHNGTLSNHWALCHKYKLNMQDYDVDSHVIAAILGKEKNFNVIKEIDGAAAFLMTNKQQPDILYVFRNDKRPLFRGVIEKDMYISSIKESLEYIGCENIQEFKEDTLYTIKNGVIITNNKIKNVPHTYASTNHIGLGVSRNNLNERIYTSDLNKLWLRSNRTVWAMFSKPLQITSGEWYFSENTNYNDSTVQLKDNRGELVWVPKYCFDLEDSVIKRGCYVEVLSNLVKTTDEKYAIFDKGDIVAVEAYYQSYNSVLIKSTKDEYEYTVDTKFVRRLTRIEEDNYIASQLLEESANTNNDNPTEDEIQNQNLPTLFPFSEGENLGIEFQHERMEGPINHKLSLEEEDIEEENTEKDIDDEDFYDVGVNSTEVCIAFAELDEISEKLLEFGKKHVVADKTNDFMILVHMLQSQIIDCQDKFCFEEEVEEEVSGADSSEENKEEGVASCG